MELSGKSYVYERGLLANWALHVDGFRGLLLVDMLVVGTLCLLATAVRALYSRFGFNGFARAAYVALLLPYTLAAFLATANNLVRTLV
ncbi:MAG: hypothetical protein ACE5IG_05570 [Dehalococcoidia bacterium]